MVSAIMGLILSFSSSQANAYISDKVILGTLANTCLNQGKLVETVSSFDVAINGAGWLMVQNKEGNVFYTRYGSLGMSPDGYLAHRLSGYYVVTAKPDGAFERINLLPAATKPSKTDKTKTAKLTGVTFDTDGAIKGLYSDGTVAEIARLKLAAFENQRNLRLVDPQTQIFLAPSDVGDIAFDAPSTNPFGVIYRKHLELKTKEDLAKACN